MSLSGNVDRADDLVQETLLQGAGRNLDSFQPGTNMSAWLFTILRNLFYSEYRKRRREVEDADGASPRGWRSQPEQDAPHRPRRLQRGAGQLAARPARGADPGRRLRLLLRGGRRDLRLRRRHHQEPRQPRAQPPLPSCSPSTAWTTSGRTRRPAPRFRRPAELIAARKAALHHFRRDRWPHRRDAGGAGADRHPPPRRAAGTSFAGAVPHRSTPMIAPPCRRDARDAGLRTTSAGRFRHCAD